MHEVIQKIRPHFFSLREIKNTFSLDIKIPTNWDHSFIKTKYENVDIKLQDKDTEKTLLSLISSLDEDGFNTIFSCAIEIIKFNKEREEKEKLFQEKVNELKQLFFTTPLEELKQLNFTEEHENGD